MKTYRTVLFTLIIAAVILGCDSSDEDSEVSYISTLSSETYLEGGFAYIQGFDFSEGTAAYENPAGWDENYDMALQIETDGGGNPTGASLYTTHRRPAFIEIGYSTLDEITEAPEDGYNVVIYNLEPEKCYCIITAEGNYAKILLLDMDYEETDSGVPYVWIEFQWYYQSDGSRFFDY